jgi:hypothetical protein
LKIIEEYIDKTNKKVYINCMDKDFINLAVKIIDEKGKNILENSKITKGLFMDYSKGQYKAEINLLVKIIELGFYNKIMESDNLNITKMTLSRQLQKDLFIMDKIASSMVELLIGLLRDRNYIQEIIGYNDNMSKYNNQATVMSNNLQSKTNISGKKLINNSKSSNKILHKMKTQIKIYQEPNYDSEIVCRLLIGETIKYLEKEKIEEVEWCKVRDSHNNEGWCELKLLV